MASEQATDLKYDYLYFMKRILLLLTLAVMQLTCYPQDTLRICPDLDLIRISDNAFVHVSYAKLPGYGRVSANGLIFIDGDEAFLFDTPWNDSLTCILVSYLEEKMKLKITGFIPNHWHDDCMGGFGCIKSKNIRSYATRLTLDIARSIGLPVPDVGFTDSLTLRLGDKMICCWFPGPAHSMDNIVVWIPSGKILFPCCICKSLDSHNLGNIADGDVTSYCETVERIIVRFDEAEIVIPGHGASGGRELLVHTRTLSNSQQAEK